MKYVRLVLLLIQVLFFLSFISFSQGKNQAIQKKDSLQKVKPEKKRTIEDWRREEQARNEAERNLLLHLRRMGPGLRALIQQMKDDGVTKENARSKHVDKVYSNDVFHVDSLGRIRMELYVRNLQISTIQTLESLGVKIHLYVHQKGMPEAAAVDYLKKSGVGIVWNYAEGPGILDCYVPFGVVEEVAKMKSIGGLNAIFESLQNAKPRE